jgi:hypothetical protein
VHESQDLKKPISTTLKSGIAPLGRGATLHHEEEDKGTGLTSGKSPVITVVKRAISVATVHSSDGTEEATAAEDQIEVEEAIGAEDAATSDQER